MEEEKNKGGRPPFVPTEDETKLVGSMAAVGITHEQIALVIRDGIDADTLKKHFKDVLRTSKVKAHAKIGAEIYTRAIQGDTTLLIFYAKTQMGWKEGIDLNLSGEVGGEWRVNIIKPPSSK